ncbi:MAG: galactose ABC transporter substrate-binding protein [Ruminococcaceae bacterium]|nr:galactose ABC transporter substrate-binding protein [Oscillospiraceae bacterium]
MKKTILLLLILAAALTSFVSCGRGAEEVSVFYYTYSDTYISGVRAEMNEILKKSGLDYHNYDANSNQTTQTEQIDTAISKGTKMLIVNVVDTGSDDAARTIVEKAKAANVPLIFFNRSVSQSVVESYDKCIFVGTDYEMAGHMQGKLIGEYVLENYSKIDLNGDGKISYCLFKGQQGNAEAEARTRYAVEDANKILEENGKPKLYFYDQRNPNGYLVDQDGNWSNAAANNHMKTILSAYSEANKNMVELVIANNDEMALGAIAALNEAGYNKSGAKTIPVFGVDATDAAKNKINAGVMAGTIKQDAEGMAEAIVTIANNFIGGNDIFMNIDDEYAVGKWRVNIPYSAYTGDDAD